MDRAGSASHTKTCIGPNDLMIATIAESNNLTLVTTHNTAEFRRVKSLRIDDWQT
jgi:predicted nucleic acid-binding protein